MTKPCPHGGECIDPREPTECEINKYFTPCMNFRSAEEKAAFDARPDLFEVVDRGGGRLFKTEAQVKAYIEDWIKDESITKVQKLIIE